MATATPDATELIEIARRPWTTLVGNVPVVVRPARVQDLPAVVRMHRHCSARSLLDRYKQGGRPPSSAALDAELRNPDGIVAVGPSGLVLATGSVRRDPRHGERCAEISVLVADGSQRLGLGSVLLAHLAGLAYARGFCELVAYPGTAIPAAQRLMVELGRTRMVPGADPHLRTYLSETATLGLGQIRQRLAG